jgi:hypothetical protein
MQDSLSKAIGVIRPKLDRALPLKARVRAYWAGVAAAANLAPSDVVRAEFLRLADETGLAADLRQHADFYNSDKTLDHVLRWGMLRRDPFGKQSHAA